MTARVYNRALSEDEIVRHYSQEIPEHSEIPWFEGPKLVGCCVLAPTATLVVTADLSRVALGPAGSVVAVDWNVGAGAPFDAHARCGRGHDDMISHLLSPLRFTIAHDRAA